VTQLVTLHLAPLVALRLARLVTLHLAQLVTLHLARLVTLRVALPAHPPHAPALSSHPGASDIIRR
jgi:hypothetical protein